MSTSLHHCSLRAEAHGALNANCVMQCISNKQVDWNRGRCKLTVTSTQCSVEAADITSLCQCAWAVWQEPWWGTASCACHGSASCTEPALSDLAGAARPPAHNTPLRQCGRTLSAAPGTPPPKLNCSMSVPRPHSEPGSIHNLLFDNISFLLIDCCYSFP